mmetsp:Transcript_22489/g.60848  ORF Transcript_22489/g.60848 Transcript_22489/m.60848 type:complete len:268 (-) Transcript_22489:843-1646(-)
MPAQAHLHLMTPPHSPSASSTASRGALLKRRSLPKVPLHAATGSWTTPGACPFPTATASSPLRRVTRSSYRAAAGTRWRTWSNFTRALRPALARQPSSGSSTRRARAVRPSWCRAARTCRISTRASALGPRVARPFASTCARSAVPSLPSSTSCVPRGNKWCSPSSRTAFPAMATSPCPCRRWRVCPCGSSSDCARMSRMCLTFGTAWTQLSNATSRFSMTSPGRLLSALSTTRGSRTDPHSTAYGNGACITSSLTSLMSASLPPRR